MKPHTKDHHPNLILAGINKAGTTSLYYFLSAHPEICSSNIKELRYYTKNNIAGGLPPLSKYLENFSHYRGEKYIMESTPSYFSGGGLVAKTIKETLGDVRIILIFRNPIDSLFSFYRAQKGELRIERHLSFDDYVTICLQNNGPGLGACSMAPIKRGFYDDHLREWIEVFGKSIKVSFFDNLIQDYRSVVTDMCRWLEIDEAPIINLKFTNENPSIMYRNAILHKFASRFTNANLQGRINIPSGLKRRIRKIYFQLNGTSLKETLKENPTATARLERLYEPHNKKFAVMLSEFDASINLPDWLT